MPRFSKTIVAALCCWVAAASLGAAEPASPGDPLESWWKHARTKIERILEEQGRTPEAVESPKWFEQPYNTAGRMPLVDLCLGQPLVMPEVAGHFDRRVREAQGRLADLFLIAEEMAAAAKLPPPIEKPEDLAVPPSEMDRIRPVLEALAARGKELQVRTESIQAIIRLAVAAGCAHLLREKAFAAFSPAERGRLSELLPAYFVRQTPAGETIRGYTAALDDVPELLDLLRKVDFTALRQAGYALARFADAFRARWKTAGPQDLPPNLTGVLFEAEAFFGRVVVTGTGPDVHTRDAALLVDLGGDDTYLNHAAAASLDGPGAAILVDLGGNDRYLAAGNAQACAVGGVSLLLDLAGDDLYASRHYSQGAALCGYSFLCDESGDDTYVGELGVQGFAMFGSAVLCEGGGRDSYRCASMGQGCASTLGVAILAEAGGDDVYRAGGKHGFYDTWDAGCAQGAASGMRPWPPMGKITVYGGVGLLSEASGNDTYSNYNIGQGGSYLQALGLFVDSAGNDVYQGLRYNRGVGVHVSAGVAIDRQGNDFHAGDFMENGVSLDRSAGIFIDLGGDDVYRIRVSNGFGFNVKPRGFSCFVDAGGDDVYSGPATFGFPDKPWSEDSESTAFFFDFGGKDTYPSGSKASNDATWTEREFGRGEDAEVKAPERGTQAWWAPAELPAGPALPDRAKGMASPSPLARFAAARDLLDPANGGLEALLAVARDGHEFARKDLIDAVRIWWIGKKIAAKDADRLAPLLDSPDRDLRILGLFVLMQLETGGPAAVTRAGEIALSDPSPDARGIACLALGRSGAKEAAGPLRLALRSPFRAVRRRAALGLVELKAPEAAPDLQAALEAEPWAEARAHAAEALGALRDEAYLPAIQKALLDRDEMVRFYAARSLLKDFGRPEGMEHLFALARWDGGAMAGLLLWGFLKAYTGKEIAGTEKDWRAWWDGAAKTFDAAAHGRIFQLCEDADEASRKGEEERAVEIYREIRRIDPRHATACEEVSKALNGRAWEIALSGKDCEKGLKLAEEAADAKADPDIVDTLAVLQFLTGDRKKAEETVRKALEQKGIPADKVEMLKRRLEEFKAGKLNLH